MCTALRASIHRQARVQQWLWDQGLGLLVRLIWPIVREAIEVRYAPEVSLFGLRVEPNTAGGV
jgi:hypothetical protein